MVRLFALDRNHALLLELRLCLGSNSKALMASVTDACQYLI